MQIKLVRFMFILSINFIRLAAAPKHTHCCNMFELVDGWLQTQSASHVNMSQKKY